MDEQDILEALRDGTFFRRFTREEQIGSSDAADRFLWLAIFRAERELAETQRGGVREGADYSSGGKTPPYRFLEDISEPLPKSFDALVARLGVFQDRGKESVVFDGGDGFVSKLRLMVPSILSGYLAPLANIVYHNRLFPRDRYTLENIYAFDDDRFFMVLRQERVEIALDENDYPIKPSADQIRKAIYALKVGLCEFEREQNEEDDLGDSSTADSDEESAEHLKFFNSDSLPCNSGSAR